MSGCDTDVYSLDLPDNDMYVTKYSSVSVRKTYAHGIYAKHFIQNG